MKVSQNQKLFFQNPENRRMRGLQMKGGSKLHGGYVATTSFLGMSCSCKVVLDDGVLWMNDWPLRGRWEWDVLAGVKFSCKHCGREGHRRHFCPELGYVKKGPRTAAERVYRCGLCRQLGHTRRQCPQRHRQGISGGSGAEAEVPLEQEDEEKEQRRRGPYKCGHCHQLGHSRRTCPHLHQHQEWRSACNTMGGCWTVSYEHGRMLIVMWKCIVLNWQQRIVLVCCGLRWGGGCEKGAICWLGSVVCLQLKASWSCGLKLVTVILGGLSDSAMRRVSRYLCKGTQKNG
jgi:hypothetical protein